MISISNLVESNRIDVQRALLRIEYRAREESCLPKLADNVMAFLPGGVKAGLRLLNLRVWSLRYCVSVEYILEVLLGIFARQRRSEALAESVSLGLPVATITGVRARELLEERIAKDFPNGENRKVAALKQAKPVQLSYGNAAEFVARYNRAMRRRQKQFSEPAVLEYERNFRKI